MLGKYRGRKALDYTRRIYDAFVWVRVYGSIGAGDVNAVMYDILE